MAVRAMNGQAYDWLLDWPAVIAAHGVQESELGAAAFAAHALLAPLPPDGSGADGVSRWVALLGFDEPSLFRPRTGSLAGVGDLGRRLVLHEGYRVHPERENAGAIEALRAQLGGRLLASRPDAWSAWADKGSFRSRAERILGPGSVPPGVCLGPSDETGWNHLAQELGVSPHRRVLKVPGTGGSGNHVLTAGEALQPDTAGRLASIDGQAVSQVVVEEWLPWQVSLSVSFLVLPGDPPHFLAVTQQLVDLDTAKFLGSSDRVALDQRDVDALCAQIVPLFEAMAREGIVGVTAVDLIVGAWPRVGLALPSGLRMCVIECNPRFNRHNRVGLLVHRLSRLWRVPAESLTWTLRDEPTTVKTGAQPPGLTPADPTTALEGPPCRLALDDAHRTMQLTVERAVS